MAFTVRYSGQSQPQEYGDDDGFEFLEGGVLAVHHGDEETPTEYHPPSRWEQVCADPEHLAGMNTPYVEDDDYDDEEDDAFDDEEYEEDEYEDGDDED